MENLEAREKTTRTTPLLKDDTIFVALGTMCENNSDQINLMWALNNFRGRKICILHVHQPAHTIPIFGTTVPISQMDEHQVKTYHEMERRYKDELVEKYFWTCRQEGVHAEKIIIEMDSIEKGIVKLISEHGIKWLVMGAAAYTSYSSEMKEPESMKAIHVCLEAPSFCHIWFVCNGNLIHTRESTLGGYNIETESPPFQASPNEENNIGFENNGDQRSSVVASSSIVDDSLINTLYDRVDELVAEAESTRKEVYDESMRRQKAEEDVTEEIIQRTQTEEALARSKEEAEMMKFQLEEVIKELKDAQEQNLSLEYLIADANKTVHDLEIERDCALEVAAELTKTQNDGVLAISFSEIEKATDSQGSLIGEGSFGSVYKGHIRHTEVAIRVLPPDTLQVPLEFKQAVNVLSKFRHPNIVTLIGVCPEPFALIYEYLPNGSLKDRLNCENNTPPLSWEIRIRIATELCSALVFLHSEGLFHGHLKPDNILLDANFVSKLSDLERCKTGFSENITTSEYTDPEFFETGEFTAKSDVYSFGIVLLRLLTGRPALGITNEVQDALDHDNLNDLLGPTAVDWPFVQAKQLAHLAMCCSDMDSTVRPDLASEVWRVLEPMKVSRGVSSLRVGSEERSNIPSYFVCPIIQVIMQDPVLAADGYTYEAEALQGWLDSGHDTSPMTNLTLSHTHLVPNRALRSAIQEWLQQS